MSDNGHQTVVVTHSVYIEHATMIQSHARASGMNKSAALRDILDQWEVFCELDTDASNAGGDQVPA